MSGGISHPPLILGSLVVLGFAADLMRGEGFAAANVSAPPKEEERCRRPTPEGCSLSAARQQTGRAAQAEAQTIRNAPAIRSGVTPFFTVLLSSFGAFPSISWFQSRAEMFSEQRG